MTNNKQIILSAIQPSKQLTIGNYLGALESILQFSTDANNELFLFVADLHVLSANHYDPATLATSTLEVLKLYYAAGLDFKRHHIFIQSHIPAHTQLFNVLLNFSTMGELDNMTQFKDKSAKLIKQANNTTSIKTSLLTYPVLMAADILLYDANIVPVGKDQVQHLELCKKLAKKINKQTQQELFSIPKPFISTTNYKIKDLVNPMIKMSKSNPENGTIFLNDDLEVIKNKIMHATTDNFGKIAFDEINQPGISNLLTIASACSNKSINKIIEENSHNDYKLFKIYVSDIVCKKIAELQTKIQKVDTNHLLKLVANNEKYCNKIANKKMQQVYKTLGLL